MKLVNILSAIILLASFAVTPAYGQGNSQGQGNGNGNGNGQGGEGGNTNCNGVGNANSPCNPGGGTGGGGNSATVFGSVSGNVTMTIGLYASITGLDDFTLTTTDIDGSAGAVYDGADNFNVESNGQVRVVLSGANLTNGSDSVSTVYELDSTGGTTFDTTSGVVHNASHSVSAAATLGAISDQLSGNYASTVTLTVSAL